jgi:hypothetical protein
MVLRRISMQLGLALAVALVAITGIAALPAGPPNLNKALEAQRKLAADKPQDPAVYNDLGNLEVMAGQNAAAEEAYRHAVELDPQRVSALFNLGLLLQERGERREAQKLFQQVIEIEPNHAWAHYQSGALYEAGGSEGKAIDEYARAFALDPQLAFPEVNAHVVENKLVTQAMLRAYRGDYAPPQAPKVYEDPVRIAKLLVPPPAKPADAAATAPDQAVGKPDPTAGRTIRERDLDGRNVGQATPQGVVGGRPGYQRPGMAAPGYPTYQGQQQQPVYQPVPGVGVPGARPVPERTLRDFSRPQAGQPGGTVITPPPGGVYYRPDPPSTGRLDLKLVPGRPQDTGRALRG